MKKKVAVQVDKTNTALPNWDLSIGYYKGLDDPQIELDKESLKRLSKELELYRNQLAELEPYQLAVLLQKYESMIELAHKLSYYAFLYSDTHKTDRAANNFASKINESISTYFERLGFINYELNSLPPEKMIEFLNHPKCSYWIPWLTRIFNSYWSLNEAASFIIDQKSIVSSAWDRLYSETCAKLRFSFNGKSLNDAEISAKAASDDPEVRKKVMKEINRVYKNNADVFTLCYNMILKDKETDDTLYGFDEPMEESLSSNHITRENLLAMSGEVVDSYIPISQRFFKLLAKMMKVDRISYEDRNFNPIPAPKTKVTWEKCVQKVLQAYADFSLDYAMSASSIINQNLIDVPPAKGKRSGAYCIRGEYPYILLNFTGSESDITTFAHELGHGVHHLLLSRIGVLNDSTPTALAEVASEFAENLVFRQQLEAAKTDREKLRLYINRVEEMLQSVHRQISFFKFENRAHRERRKGELSTERLNQIWREETSRYLGFDIGEDGECLWMSISHLFNTPYYVYSYAFAGLVVNNLILAYEKWDEDREFETKEDFPSLYFNMLASTGVENFVSLLEPFGIDATSPDFWDNGLSLITKYIDEIERLAKKEGLI